MIPDNTTKLIVLLLFYLHDRYHQPDLSQRPIAYQTIALPLSYGGIWLLCCDSNTDRRVQSPLS